MLLPELYYCLVQNNAGRGCTTIPFPFTRFTTRRANFPGLGVEATNQSVCIYRKTPSETFPNN